MRQALLVAIWFGIALYAAADDEYRTVDTAIAAKSGAAQTSASVIPGHFGVILKTNALGQVVVDQVEAESAADKASLKPGDKIVAFNGNKVGTLAEFRQALRAKGAGERIRLTLERQGKAQDVTTILQMPSRPLTAVVTQPTLLGVEVSSARNGEGVVVDVVHPGSAADKAKIRVGEMIYKIDDVAIDGPDQLRAFLAGRKTDDTVTLSMFVAEKRVDMKLKLAERERPNAGAGGNRRGGGWMRAWTKPAFRIAIILVEYPDQKHNSKIPPAAWADAMFSQGGTYKKSATEQVAYGSMHDYYWEQSYGNLKIEGKAFDYVEVSKKRLDYNTGPRQALLTEAMDLLLKREGKDALKEFDGVFFIYAGGRMQVARGSLYWPHMASVQHDGKSWRYFICPEGGNRMADISVFCHEFGHILGIPDLYARPENPGMEGVGIWSAMANQAPNGRPQHFDAWSKDRLGWIKPVTLDPAVKQKLILAPIEDSAKECFKIPVQPDGSEYFLLENRRQKGFDKSLPGEGLLIWRVIGNRPILEEAHGVAGPSGPRLFMRSVPFPSEANDSFTPFTIPSSRSQLPGGVPVYITNIRTRPDGKVSFHIGYEYQ